MFFYKHSTSTQIVCSIKFVKLHVLYQTKSLFKDTPRALPETSQFFY